MSEFDLIARYFTREPTRAALGVGDDCALLDQERGMQMAISSDMLVEGRHFFPDVDPAALGHKALAVNLSDLAACGATPRAFTLALALPHVDEAWLQQFSAGLWALSDAHGCELIGGDTTRGPLNICITVFGDVPRGQALLRSGAQAGDDIYVSGNLGDARLALEMLQGKLQLPPQLHPKVLAEARIRLERPIPRVALGQALRGVATAAIDISDGFVGDLCHILKASGVGATIHTHLATKLIACSSRFDWTQTIFDAEKQLRFALAGGDDYELAFTAPPHAHQTVLAAAARSQTPVTLVGRVETQPGLRLIDVDHQSVKRRFSSFDHFGDFGTSKNAADLHE